MPHQLFKQDISGSNDLSLIPTLELKCFDIFYHIKKCMCKDASQWESFIAGHKEHIYKRKADGRREGERKIWFPLPKCW